MRFIKDADKCSFVKRLSIAIVRKHNKKSTRL